MYFARAPLSGSLPARAGREGRKRIVVSKLMLMILFFLVGFSRIWSILVERRSGLAVWQGGVYESAGEADIPANRNSLRFHFHFPFLSSFCGCYSMRVKCGEQSWRNCMLAWGDYW